MDHTVAAIIYSINNAGYWLAKNADLATGMLLSMFLGCWRVLAKAQQRKNVDLMNLLKNAEGKFSYLNAGGIGCFVFSTWVVMHDTLDGTITNVQFIGYLLFWSGAPVANVLASKWDGRLPWSKPE
jgi:hypothetical protein